MKNINTALQDMLDAIESVESYAVKSFEIFSEDSKTQDAVMYNLIILGEAANRIPIDFQEDHPEIPWHQSSEPET
jgi:uncharacterized protein with HEPN domain